MGRKKILTYRCTKCGEHKVEREFHQTHDKYLNSNGLMPVCKKCVGQMFTDFYTKTNSVEKTLLNMCRWFNLRYEQGAVDAAKKMLESRGIDMNNIYGFYRTSLLMTLKSSVHDTIDTLDLTYKDNPTIVLSDKSETPNIFDDMERLGVEWGTTNKEEINFLETQFANFKQTHKADTYAEIVLLREVCHKMLQIDRDRKASLPTDGSTKQLMEIMKSLAISPNQANSASSGKSMDTFGVWLAEIEKERPAEWVEDKSIYKDVDDIEGYNERIFLSPLRSFVSGSKEFSLEDSDEEVELDFEGE